MVLNRIVRDDTDTKDLIETYSDENYKLLQVETNKIYGHSVIDIIDGYDIYGFPYAKYTYTETDEKDEEPIEEDYNEEIF